MKFNDVYIDKKNRFSIGQEEKSGACYISFPVRNAMVDYEEYYELPIELYNKHLKAMEEVVAYVQECRNRQHDSALLVKPGKDRGVPT